MPGPTTEVLNDDVKGLRDDFHKVEVSLSTALARLAAEFGLFKWLVGLTLATALSGVVGSAYWAGSLASRVGSLEDRATKVEGRLAAIEGRLGEIDKHLERIDANLGRILDRLPPKP